MRAIYFLAHEEMTVPYFSFSLMDAGYAMPVGVLSLLHGDEADDVEQDQVDYDLDMRWG